jgi:uncharacterized damage-inducible protein DinB
VNPILRDMFGHQFWADAVLWNAIGAHQPARDDPAIRLRLHHIHSHHHRGQNAAALRELGGEPPPTDLIVWYWKEKPGAPW